MNKREAKQIVERSNASFESSERTNFKSLWESASEMCRPTDNNILSEKTKGERKNNIQRLIDVGVNSLDIFTSGVTSTLTPKGSRFFEFAPSKTHKKSDEYSRWLTDCSKITLDYINESNFFSEVAKNFSDLGLIGTSLIMTEPDVQDGLRFKSFYINTFSFQEDYNGRVDTVFFKLSFNARQIQQKFGDEAMTSKMRSNILKNIDTMYDITHAIYPRSDYNNESINPKKHKYMSIYILTETGDILLESGFRQMPASVCRWSQTTNELYGRSPAIQCSGNLSMSNVMEVTKLKSAQRIASPQWLVSDDGTTRNLNNNAGGVVYWNSSNPSAKPEQINPRDMPNITDNYQQQKYSEIEDAFFISIWNPLRNVSGNTTKSEIEHRVNIAKMNLVPKVSRVQDELLQPTFRRIFQILLDSGKFPEQPIDIDISNIKVNFISSAGLILRQLENAGILQTTEIVAMLSDIDPQAIDYLDIDEIVKSTAHSNAVPTNIIRSDYEVKVIREERSKNKAVDDQHAKDLEISAMYGNTNKAPESGSPADILMKQG